MDQQRKMMIKIGGANYDHPDQGWQQTGLTSKTQYKTS